MATALRAVEPTVEETVGALVDQTVANPVAVFTDEAKFSDFYARLKEETDRHVPDLSTAGGRKAIASLAFRVTKAKTSLDKAGLGLTEEWRNQIALVNASRKKMTAELDQLADEVRRPLTEWEDAEKARVDECEAVIAKLRQAAVVTIDDTSAGVRERGTEVYQTPIDPERFGNLFDDAMSAKSFAIATLLDAAKRLVASEKQAEELAQLQREKAEREAREAEERAQRDAAEAAAREARGAEEREREAAELARQREEAEKTRIAEAERIAAEQAAQRVRDEEVRKAREEQERRDAEHRAALQAERDRADQLEREARAERARVAEETRQREAREEAARLEAQRVAEENAKRQADQEHRTKVKTKAKNALITCGADEETARKIVVAILAGEIPAVSMVF